MDRLPQVAEADVAHTGCGHALVARDGRILQVGGQLSLWLGLSPDHLCSGISLHTLCDEASGTLIKAHCAWMQTHKEEDEKLTRRPPESGSICLRRKDGRLLQLHFACIPCNQTFCRGASPGIQPTNETSDAVNEPAQSNGLPTVEDRWPKPAEEVALARFLFVIVDAVRFAEADQVAARSPRATLSNGAVGLERKRQPSARARRLPTPAHQGEDWSVDQVHARYVLATLASTEGLWDWDQTHGRTYYSARWQSILGLPDEEITAGPDHLLRLLHPTDRDRFLSFCHGLDGSEDKVFATSKLFEGEFRMLHTDGSWRWILVRGICVHGSEIWSPGVEQQGPVQLPRIVGTINDVTRHRVLDPLTGLHNRFSLLERLGRRLDTVHSDPLSFAVLFIDLDSFKRINDSFSHLLGDSMLVEVGRRVGSTLSSDSKSFAARLGGDEFVVVLDHMIEEDVVTYTHALQALLQLPVVCGDQQISMTASIGIAMSKTGYADAEDMLQDADLAMYRAKSGGRSKFCIFTKSMREKIRARMRVEVELRHAVDANELVLHYQPKVLLKNGAITGFEALVRWNHPTRGLLSPAHFIPIAEDSDLILAVGRWTMIEAIRQISAWRHAGILPLNATVAVNLSARQFADYGLVDAIRAALKAEQLHPRYLDIEVTESALIDDTDTALATLKELKALGVGLDLDDFGMGYSSLSYLHRFPFDTLKVDRSFVTNLGEADESTAIARSVIALGAALKMKVLAEGIETAEQADRLLAMGCVYGQGYYFSPPLPTAECVRLMVTHARTEAGVGRLGKPPLSRPGAGNEPPRVAQAVSPAIVSLPS